MDAMRCASDLLQHFIIFGEYFILGAVGFVAGGPVGSRLSLVLQMPNKPMSQ